LKLEKPRIALRLHKINDLAAVGVHDRDVRADIGGVLVMFEDNVAAIRRPVGSLGFTVDMSDLAQVVSVRAYSVDLVAATRVRLEGDPAVDAGVGRPDSWWGHDTKQCQR